MFSKALPPFNFHDAAPVWGVESFADMALFNSLLKDMQSNLDSLDERIKQLKSVEQWLSMNLKMVNSAVQQMQVQRQTLQVLTQWQALSAEALEVLAQTKPLAATASNKAETLQLEKADAQHGVVKKQDTSKRISSLISPPEIEASSVNNSPKGGGARSVMFDSMMQIWWNGLQNQFMTLVQPIVTEEAPKEADVARSVKNSTVSPSGAKRSTSSSSEVSPNKA